MVKAFKITSVAITINLGIAALILMMFTGGPFRFTEFVFSFSLNIGVGILGLFSSAFLISYFMHRWIRRYKWSTVFVGILGSLLILLIGILFGSMVGFLQEGLNGDNGTYGGMEDYIFKPVFWVMMIGFVPTTISGIFLGLLLRKTPLEDGLNA